MFSRKSKPTVLVAMSGGVDSSVAAAILTKQGYNCLGAFFITWTQDIAGLEMCPWEQDVFDARRAAEKIGIPLYTFNFEKEYKERVIEYFFREYQAGRTPNPDVMCNREIKFSLFLDKANELGADYIATGHYAQVIKRGSEYQLHKGVDGNKDQSYFLYALHQAQLSRTLFPLGKLKKEKVRKQAKKFGLPNWDKKDSQGICFLGKVSLEEFLATRIPVKAGAIIDTTGVKVGEHKGTQFYTIGQRKGLHIGGAGTPYYVVAKNPETNTLVVSKEEADKSSLFTQAIIATQPTWINQTPTLPLKCQAKIRYRQPDQVVTISQLADKTLRLDFDQPQRGVAAGQSVVFYDKAKVLGGAIIENGNV